MVSASILKNHGIKSNWDKYQNLYTDIINHYCFAWTCFILVLVGKKWRNPVMYIIILHFLTRFIGYIIEDLGKLRTYQYPGYDYPSNEGYLWGHALSRVAFYICGIVGDWYLLLRTKALVKSNKKIIWVYLTCIIFNMTKIVKMYFNFIYVPYKDNFNPDSESDKFDYFLRKIKYKKNKWLCDFFLHTASIIYDITVIITLKRNVFINYENLNYSNKNSKEISFIKKFKRLSIYRIYFTMFLSICCSPIVFLFCLNLLYALNNIDNLKNEEKILFYQTYCSDTEIEAFRVSINHVAYILIYIDTILLRYYANENSITVISQKSNEYINKNISHYFNSSNTNSSNNNNYTSINDFSSNNNSDNNSIEQFNYNNGNNNSNNKHNRNNSNSSSNNNSIKHYRNNSNGSNNNSIKHYRNNSNSNSIRYYYSDNESIKLFNNNKQKIYNFSKIYHEFNNQYEDIEEFQNLIDHSKNDNINFKTQSLNRNNGGNSSKYYNNNNNNNKEDIKFYSINRYNRDKTNYYDLINKNNNGYNNNNNISVDYFSNGNNKNYEWKKYYNSLNRNN
ncbi:hypothetical protein BCR32DRAFT_281522 [Anaeromyces robustus]|uniref:Uncharacterized protein n=1 Tax=Anaeromyces robustus TaxID=1754192 RepID=A0A1Y1X1J7_9FUNG|nr:hypothetical protein BCR32DRAFT_281522 [Anaeromyces robustus]|eukprot:ORX79286.1 hypothetical protein BCR32DRAFT_281522 [Anaeromyces robustus]